MSTERPLGPGGTTPITRELLLGWPLPAPGENKEARGRTLVVGGTAHTPGAVLLAGEAVLRAGAGKLQIATAAPVAAALAVAVPEARVVPLPADDDGNIAGSAADTVLELAEQADALLVGSGFSSPDPTVALLERIIPRVDRPIVVDAVGSAYVTAHHEGLRHLDGRAILSLNPSEVALTLRIDDDELAADPVACTRKLAAVTGAVVILGGEGKLVAAPDGAAWETRAGGPGLGVSGSGDVQAGIVAGLFARGAEPAQAACWAAHLHGLAGERLAEAQGAVGFLAREISPCVPALLEGHAAP
ncbi:MAG: NAD(P)H-hydrate dehydratase [Intrasporangium sp.]|uniref:NAD(P)H-hydrate dehydratase n=1 Tax=Intrasporangium sp. TaxID=1925024 RepID=UPI003F7D3B8D